MTTEHKPSILFVDDDETYRNRLARAFVDRGSGMAQAVLARAGEPFFTTKEPGRGMGLGLFLTRTLVERLGGELLLSSEAGAGTRALVRLPIA